jgi:serine/threonine protein kinase
VYATDVSVNGTYLKKKNADCAGSQGDGILMGRSSTFLLEDGDELHISESVSLIFYSMRLIEQVKFTPTQERETAIFAQDYLVTGRLLGEGGYGKVVIGIHQETQRQVACKIVGLDHLYDRPPAPNLRLPTGPREGKLKPAKKRWPTRVAACFREFDILKDLSHPNIVSIEKVFWSNNTIYILQELVTGGDLFSFIEYKGGRLDNIQAVIVIRQILLGIEYLHAQEIVHRDLKPDNILMTSLEDGARVVITDFGSARFLPDAASLSDQNTKKPQRMFSYVGTLEYAAPEIHKVNPTIPADDGYTKAIDMWSIGSITASVLAGEVIFTDRAHPQYDSNPRLVIVSLAAQCDLSVLDAEYHPTWSEVDSLAKDFIKRLLVLDPPLVRKRLLRRRPRGLVRPLRAGLAPSSRGLAARGAHLQKPAGSQQSGAPWARHERGYGVTVFPPRGATHDAENYADVVRVAALACGHAFAVHHGRLCVRELRTWVCESSGTIAVL